MAADEYDNLREVWKEMITGGTSYNEADPDIAARITEIVTTAQTYWDTMDTSSTRTRLWNYLGTSSDHVKQAFRRLQAMALGYAVKGSALEGNTQLRDDIISAMNWMYANRYNESTPNSYNWWDWEIGSPLAIHDILVMMYDDFTEAERTNLLNAVDRFSPVVNKSGANRVWKVTVVGLNGILTKDSAKLVDARDGLSQVFDYTTGGDGFYEDGSFIQHSSFPYTGGYGKNLITDIANILYVLEGSTWTVTDPDKANVVNWVYDSFEPLIVKGAMMDLSRGREISRNAFQDHVTGHFVMQALIRVAQSAPASDAEAIKSMIKEWIAADTYRSFYADASINMMVLAKQIMSDSSIQPRGDLVLHKQFSNMDRVVHHRPDFAFGISMHSPRISNYESINSENKRAWHTADGMTYLYDGDLAQYSDDFWPTVNPYRLAGTTVLKETTVTSGRGGSAAVGGASLGDYGIVGMHLQPPGQTLDAKKAWFLFDDEVVALGADISASDSKAVETIVENRKLNSAGDNALTVEGAAKSTTLGWSEVMSGVDWAHLEGGGSGDGTGYYFPDSPTIHAEREARTGKWSDLNTYGTFGDTTPITRNYVSLWMDHGVDPTAADYAYVILPEQTASQVDDYADAPDIVVLENSGDAQAVEETELGIRGVQFWKDQTKTVDGITSDRIASVVVQETADAITVAVADPTQLNTGSIQIELDQAAVCTLEADAAVTVQQWSPTIQLSVDVNQAEGQSRYVTLKTTGNCGGDPVVQTYEVESLTFTSSGDADAVYSTDAEASGGQWRIYEADTVGDYIDYSLSVPEAGTYKVKVRGKHYHDRGRVQLSTEGADVGAPHDFYASGAAFVTTELGTVSFATSGSKSFRFTVTGKHASSSGYKIPLDAILLEEIGPAPAGSLYEAESLNGVVSVGDTFHTHNDGSATGGQFTKLAADAIGDEVSYTVPVAEPGNYTVLVREKRYTDRGSYQLYIEGKAQGAVTDQYAASESYTVTDLGSVNFSQPGDKEFRFVVGGTSGSGYNLAFDHIDLIAE